jgi:site-specific DNA recombinase
LVNVNDCSSLLLFPPLGWLITSKGVRCSGRYEAPADPSGRPWELGLEGERKRIEGQLGRLRVDIREAAVKSDGERFVECQRQADAAERALADNRARGEALAAEDITEEVLRAALERFTPVWESLTLPERERMLQLLVERVTYDGASGEIAISFRPAGIQALEMEAAK